MNWTNNWFACSICRGPTDFKHKGEDDHCMGHCKNCGKIVRLMIDSELSTANGQEGLSTKLIIPEGG